MKNLGQLLKSEREKRGLSLQEIALSLKINVRILKSIEEGEESQLPARPFLRGFVRSYAQFLKLDVDEILSLLQKEFDQAAGGAPAVSTPNETTSEASQQNTTSSHGNLKNTPRPTHDPALEGLQDGPKWYYLVGAGVLVILIVLVIKIIEKYQTESTLSESAQVELESPEPSTTVLDTLITDTETSTTIEGPEELLQTPMNVPSTTVETTTTLALATTTQGPSNTTTTTAPTTTTARPTTTTLATTTTTLRPTTTTSATTTSTAVTTTSTLVGRPTEVIVEATANVTLRFSIANERWESLSLSAGQIHVFRSRSGVKIEAADGGALKAIVNGRDVGPIGTLGRPASFSAP